MRKPPTWIRKFILSQLDRAGYRLERTDANLDPFFERRLQRLLDRKGSLSFVQIGANDGVSFDPLHPFVERHRDRVSGIVVEPLRDKFELLCRTYEGFPRIHKVNAAIHNTERRMTLYRVDPRHERKLPGWARGIASFDPRHHERAGDLARHMIAEEVPCMTLPELLATVPGFELDVLVTDTEGYDAEILSAIDFTRIRPSLIHFEHGLPVGTMTPEALDALTDRLHEAGYSMHLLHADALAFRRD
jgi:FkbM family methyltransferase